MLTSLSMTLVRITQYNQQTSGQLYLMGATYNKGVLMLSVTAMKASLPCYIPACPINRIINEVAMICHACKQELKFEGKIFRTEECPHCGADVHSCLNCLNYDRSAHNQCREPQSEWQSDRERANFCDYFIPNKLTSQGNKSATPDTRRAFDDLFKK